MPDRAALCPAPATAKKGSHRKTGRRPDHRTCQDVARVMGSQVHAARRHGGGEGEGRPSLRPGVARHHCGTERRERVPAREAAARGPPEREPRFGPSRCRGGWPPSLDELLQRLVHAVGGEPGPRELEHGSPSRRSGPSGLPQRDADPHEPVIRQVGKHGGRRVRRWPAPQAAEGTLSSFVDARQHAPEHPPDRRARGGQRPGAHRAGAGATNSGTPKSGRLTS